AVRPARLRAADFYWAANFTVAENVLCKLLDTLGVSEGKPDRAPKFALSPSFKFAAAANCSALARASLISCGSTPRRAASTAAALAFNPALNDTLVTPASHPLGIGRIGRETSN